MNFFAGRRINSRVLQRNASIFFSFLKKPTPQNTSFSKIFIQQTVCKICFNTLRKLSLIFRQKFFNKNVFIFYSFIKKSTLRKHIFFLKKNIISSKKSIQAVLKWLHLKKYITSTRSFISSIYFQESPHTI